MENKLEEFNNSTKKIFNNQNIKNILLINPPDVDHSLFNYDSAKRGRNMNYPPYDLGLISSHLDLLKIQNKILNLNHLVLTDVKNSKSEKNFSLIKIVKNAIEFEIQNFKPKFVLVTCMFSQTHNFLINVIRELRSICSIPIAIGGVYVTGSMSDEKTKPKFLKDMKGVNYIFLNEAEVSLKDFVTYVNNEDINNKLTQVIAICKNKLIECNDRSTPTGEDLNIIPTRKDLDNIWAYMNFHLNFNRLFTENRSSKLNQQYKYVRNIAELIAPNNAFVLYFASFLHHKLKKNVDNILLNQFKKTIKDNVYWKSRCVEFGLNTDHIENQKYPFTNLMKNQIQV